MRPRPAYSPTPRAASPPPPSLESVVGKIGQRPPGPGAVRRGGRRPGESPAVLEGVVAPPQPHRGAVLAEGPRAGAGRGGAEHARAWRRPSGAAPRGWLRHTSCRRAGRACRRSSSRAEDEPGRGGLGRCANSPPASGTSRPSVLSCTLRNSWVCPRPRASHADRARRAADRRGHRGCTELGGRRHPRRGAPGGGMDGAGLIRTVRRPTCRSSPSHCRYRSRTTSPRTTSTARRQPSTRHRILSPNGGLG